MLPLTIRRVVGHSMLPTLPPGTLIWGFRWYNRLKVGDVVIFRHDNKEKIKRISRVNGDQIELLGDNTSDSADSKQFGFVQLSDISAKVIWPRSGTKRIEI